jgi:hypothetical protein
MYFIKRSYDIQIKSKSLIYLPTNQCHEHMLHPTERLPISFHHVVPLETTLIRQTYLFSARVEENPVLHARV